MGLCLPYFVRRELVPLVLVVAGGEIGWRGRAGHPYFHSTSQVLFGCGWHGQSGCCKNDMATSKIRSIM
jgi:hypothetical protein